MNTNGKIDQEVETVVDKAQDIAVQVGDEAKQKIADTTALAKEQAKRVVNQVGEQAKSTVESRKTEVAQELGSVADAVRQTSSEAGAGNSPTIKEYGQRIADQLEGVSSYVNEHSVEDIMADAQEFGRRQPAVFLGGAFMLGIVVGRFLRSSSARGFSADQERQERYQTDYPDSGYRRITNTGGYESLTSYPTTGSADRMTPKD